MKASTLMYFLCISLGLIGCGSGSGNGTGGSGGTASLSDADLVGFAYQAAKLGNESGNEGSFQAPVSQSLTESRETTTMPCTVGDVKITEQGNETIHEYSNCENTSPTLYQWMDGRTVVTSVAPVEGFSETEQTVLEDMVTRFSVGDDFIEQHINGNHETSSNPGVNTLRESDISNKMTYQCGDAQGSLTSQYTMTSEMEYTSEGMKYDTDLALSVSGQGAFDGGYTISTLETVYYLSGSDNPYLGKQEISLPNGQTVVVTYESDGLYIDGEFHSWDVLINEAAFQFPTTSNCFNAGSGSGGLDDGQKSPGVTATINGEDYHDESNALVIWRSDGGYMRVGSGIVHGFGLFTELTIYVREAYGPGTYSGQQSEIVYSEPPEGSIYVPGWTGEADVSVTIEAFGPDLIEGTFSGTLYPREDNLVDDQNNVEVTNGTFSILPLTFDN